MQIPRRVDYGLRAVIYLSGQNPDKCCSIAEIAKEQGVPRKFLEKIIQESDAQGADYVETGSLRRLYSWHGRRRRSHFAM